MVKFRNKLKEEIGDRIPVFSKPITIYLKIETLMEFLNTDNQSKLNLAEMRKVVIKTFKYTKTTLPHKTQKKFKSEKLNEKNKKNKKKQQKKRKTIKKSNKKKIVKAKAKKLQNEDQTSENSAEKNPNVITISDSVSKSGNREQNDSQNEQIKLSEKSEQEGNIECEREESRKPISIYVSKSKKKKQWPENQKKE